MSPRDPAHPELVEGHERGKCAYSLPAQVVPFGFAQGKLSAHHEWARDGNAPRLGPAPTLCAPDDVPVGVPLVGTPAVPRVRPLETGQPRGLPLRWAPLIMSPRDPAHPELVEGHERGKCAYSLPAQVVRQAHHERASGCPRRGAPSGAGVQLRVRVKLVPTKPERHVSRNPRQRLGLVRRTHQMLLRHQPRVAFTVLQRAR